MIVDKLTIKVKFLGDKGVGGGGRGEIENMVGWCKRSVVLSILDAFKEVAEGSGSGSGWGLD